MALSARSRHTSVQARVRRASDAEPELDHLRTETRPDAGTLLRRSRKQVEPSRRGGGQRQLEREGALRQRRLGQLGTVDSAGAVEVEEEDEPEEKPAKEKE